MVAYCILKRMGKLVLKIFKGNLLLIEGNGLCMRLEGGMCLGQTRESLRP